MSVYRLRRKHHIGNSATIKKMFFDFYALECLTHFCGPNSLNFECRRDRIRYASESAIDTLYTHVKDALRVSVMSEYENAQCNYHGDEQPRYKPGASLQYIRNVFAQKNRWNHSYGGKKWAIATDFVMQNPTTYIEKTIWIDRVFDLQHNTGFILNKTDFNCLEGEIKPKKGRRQKILNFRASAKFVDLLDHCSLSTKKLAFANSCFIPVLFIK
jgi:hypothetical protein